MYSSGILAPIPRTLAERANRFLSSPLLVKCLLLAHRFPRLFPEIPRPVQLFLGQWWLAEGSSLDNTILAGIFEGPESLFVRNLLKPGAVVLDIGAHHGYYTLIASKCVGHAGRVIAFEPSPRERIRLQKHVRLNSCRNVRIEPLALGAANAEMDLFLVDGTQDWCNSLKPPAVDARTSQVRVRVRSLDDFMADANLPGVDFLKLDIEGAELEALKGARKLLTSGNRPVLMVEVENERTKPWGYDACEIVRHLDRMGYQWFELDAAGGLQRVASDLPDYEANLVAIPSERIAEVLKALGEQGSR
jgi:FkbM family methyltransferase